MPNPLTDKEFDPFLCTFLMNYLLFKWVTKLEFSWKMSPFYRSTLSALCISCALFFKSDLLENLGLIERVFEILDALVLDSFPTGFFPPLRLSSALPPFWEMVLVTFDQLGCNWSWADGAPFHYPPPLLLTSWKEKKKKFKFPPPSSYFLLLYSFFFITKYCQSPFFFSLVINCHIYCFVPLEMAEEMVRSQADGRVARTVFPRILHGSDLSQTQRKNRFRPMRTGMS